MVDIYTVMLMKTLRWVIFLAMVGWTAAVCAQVRILYGPYLQNLYDREVTVVWESNQPSVGWVELAPDDGTHFYASERPRRYDTENGVKRVSTLHSVRITGLQPGTAYRYRVYVQEVLSHKGTRVRYGDIAATDVWQRRPLKFTTLDPSKQEFSFLMINDIHGRDSIAGRLLELGDYKKRDLIFFNGDMVTAFRDRQTVFDGFMSKAVSMFAAEQGMYYARGNHETRGEFATAFQQYFSPQIPRLYYAFRHGPVAFVVLDTGEDKPDTDIEYCGITDYDNYRTEQQKWLEELAGSEWLKEASFVVAVFHMPPSEGEMWHGQREVLEKFVPALNRMGTDVMLCGHLHTTRYNEADGAVHCPVLINSNASVLTVKASADSLQLEVLDLSGKSVLRKGLSSRRNARR